jgi:tetratricopeptide (TPR) repeat protein
MAGQNDQAAHAFRRAIDIEEPLHQSNPKHRNYRLELAMALDDYGMLLWSMGQRPEGERLCRRAFELRKVLVAGDIRKPTPAWTQQLANDPIAIQFLARSYNRLAIILAAKGQHADAEDHHKRAVDYAAQLAGRWTNMKGYVNDSLRYRHDRAAGNNAAAEKTFAQLLASERQLVRQLSTDAAAYHTAARNLLYGPYPKLWNPNQARAFADRAVKLTPANFEYRATLAHAHLRMWDWQAAISEWASAGLLWLGFDAANVSVFTARRSVAP